ncbi:MAG: ArsR family transcriptional regulator [Chloroflexi bacterium]|nr:MAG: ArsR family transcriptional regulator [Chloroflexota bacterium]
MAENTQLIWEVGTAYDLFTSLDVLHTPDRYGLRGSWAAGVRSRLPVEQREMLQAVVKKSHIWTIPWLAGLEGVKDSQTIMDRIAEIPASHRLPTFAGCYLSDNVREFLLSIMERGSWNEQDKGTLKEFYKEMYRKEGKKKKKIPDDELEQTLTIWANAEEYGEGYLKGLETYYEVFFAEEERRIRPALEETLEVSQALAKDMPLEDLLNQLSQGLRYDFEGTDEMKELLMVPSFWTTPLTLFSTVGEGNERWIFMYGGRPASMSLVPGDVVPELLHQTLKALADPTRLRILKYLAEEPLTPAELARRLRLRPPTVIHHLDSLRLARLVHVTLSHHGRRYEARREAIDDACGLLGEFLDS